MTKSPKRPITLVPPPEDPVKRRLMKKTDLRNDESVMNIDVNLFDVMHTLTKDETVQETKHDEDKDAEADGSSRKAEEAEVSERNGCDDSGQKSDSNTMGRSRERRTTEIQIGLEGPQSMSGAHTARDVFTNTVDTVAEKRCWLRAHTTETTIQNQTTSQLQLTYTAFLHAVVDQDLFAQPPEPDEWYDAGLKEDEVWRLNRALYGYRKAPKLWHQHLVGILESLNYHPLLTDPSCFRNDETTVCFFGP